MKTLNLLGLLAALTLGAFSVSQAAEDCCKPDAPCCAEGAKCCDK